MKMSETLKFYQDSPHPCSYLENRAASNIYPDPNKKMTSVLYSHLIQHGFRRSGELVYRPYCSHCHACIPVRIMVNDFKPNRSQQRCLKRNKHLSIKMHSATFNSEHYQLYCRYLATRHEGGGMDNPTKESYLHFLMSEWAETQFIEIRDKNKLVAVAVTDYVNDGLSAFYTFFDPLLTKQSLGTLAILNQIDIAKTLDLPCLYLGYWIKDCQKMQYKQNFSAVEAYINQQWQSLKS